MMDKSWFLVALTSAVSGCTLHSDPNAKSSRSEASEKSEITRQAIEQRDRMPPMPRGNPGAFSPLELTPFWEYVGPTYYHSGTDQSRTDDLWNGRINGVAFDAYHRGTWYAASPNGGIWRTSDSGANWAPITDSWSCLQISTIAVDSRTDNLYAGGGDAPKLRSGGSFCSAGVMKSGDGGAHWHPIGLANLTIPKLLVDPDQSTNIIAATATGVVYRNTSGGEASANGTVSWDVVIDNPTNWSDLAYGLPNASGQRYLYAVGDSTTGGLFYRSQDHGATWTPRKLPLTVGLDANKNPIAQVSLSIAASQTEPNKVYLLAQSDHKVLVSNDAGDTWKDITGNIGAHDKGWFWDQANYNYAIAVTTTGTPAQDVIYIATTDSYQSIGGDGDWTQIATSTDNHGLAIDPFDKTSFITTSDYGIYYLTYDRTTGNLRRTSVSGTLGVSIPPTIRPIIPTTSWRARRITETRIQAEMFTAGSMSAPATAP
jgi:hypothetical protein